MQKAAGEDEVSDRLSELPDSVIHQIFGLMRSPKEVAQAQFLSKSWKRVFDSYPEVDFDQSWFRRAEGKEEEESERFKEYVEKSLARRLDGVHRFRLCTDVADMQLIAGWIRSAMDKGVKELDVTVEQGDETLPIESTRSSSIITSLKIAGGPLRSLAAMEMCNLRRISIGRAEFLDENLMKKIEENSPLLEDLRLVDCPKLTHLEISSLLKLQRVEVQRCDLIQRVKIAAPDLKTFRLHGENYKSCRVDIECTGNLRNLTLKKNCVSKRFRIIIEKPIWSIKCSKLGKVKSDALNLYSFQYELHRLIGEAHRLSEVKFSFYKSHAGFHQSKQLKLITYTTQNMKVYEDPRESETFTSPREADMFLLQNHEYCKVEVTASSFEAAKSVYRWLRECHGTSLVLPSSNTLLFHLIYRMVMEREREPKCCKFKSEKCWKHYVKDVFQDFDDEVNTSYLFTWRRRSIGN